MRPRGIFGSAQELKALFPDFSTSQGIKQARQQGYQINEFRGSKSFGKESRILEEVRNHVLAPILAYSSLYEPEARAVIGVVTDLLFDPPKEIDFARHFTLPEYARLSELILESRSCGVSISIVAPVCPDYPDTGYELGGGMSLTASRFLDVLPSLLALFKKRDIDAAVEIDVADAEAVDPFLRSRMKVPVYEFLARTESTQATIREEVQKRGLERTVQVGSMLERCQVMDLDYDKEQQKYVCRLFGDSTGKATKVLEALTHERLKHGDFQDLGFSPDEYVVAAAHELAGYAVYGDMIGPDALICSPDAESAVPAYNMLKRDKNEISPTTFIKPPRREHRELFAE